MLLCKHTFLLIPEFSKIFFQHREGVEDSISSAHHSRYRRRGDRLLSRPRPVRALPQGCGAPLGGGGRSQRHRALQSVLGKATALHQPGPCCSACLRNEQPLCLTVCAHGCVSACLHACERGRQHVCKYACEIDPKRMCDFGHICVSLTQHIYRLNTTYVLFPVFKDEKIFLIFH